MEKKHCQVLPNRVKTSFSYAYPIGFLATWKVLIACSTSLLTVQFTPSTANELLQQNKKIKKLCHGRNYSTSSRVCITVSNSPNPSSVYIRLCKHGKRFLLLNWHTVKGLKQQYPSDVAPFNCHSQILCRSKASRKNKGIMMCCIKLSQRRDLPTSNSSRLGQNIPDRKLKWHWV